jgi:ribulose-5-phosphate 4-epimerase/fuculose-1-phosphate aldolase
LVYSQLFLNVRFNFHITHPKRKKAFENSIALEACAKMAYYSISLNSKINFPSYILNKHFTRKHGDKAYYSQKMPYHK